MDDKKWYVFLICGEGNRRWACELTKEESKIISNFIRMQLDSEIKCKEDYCGTLTCEAGPYNTKEEAKQYIERWDYYYESSEEADIEDFYNYYDYYYNVTY